MYKEYKGNLKRMKLKEPTNANYAVVVCSLDKFIDLPNCDNIKAALVCGGNSVIVSKSAQTKEIGLYFPVECQISHEFLSQNNLYRKGEWGNIDSTKSGFFELNRRVKAVKFRGNKSEGFWIPVNSLSYLGIPIEAFTEGLTFDAIGDNEICRKYIAKRNPIGQPKLRGRQPRLEDKIVEHQFRFHYDVENLRRNIHKIQPEDWISISDKWHGTSVVIANVLVNRNLPFYERILKWFGVTIQEHEYGLAYSSRRVLKEVNGETKTNLHFYGTDIWGLAANKIKDIIPKGYTIYAEIVGFTPSGAEIQKGYSYGCPVGSHRLLVYRVTSTNPDGHTIELNWPQMVEFCTKYGLENVKELWYGKAKHFLDTAWTGSDFDIRTWQENLLSLLEATFVRDQMCEYNEYKVPAEGIVVRIDKLDQSEAFKLKNFKFLCEESKLLDKGESDIETEQSEEI
jgi:hypothetical protein